ncbi:MAG TPA: hypothetical protein VIJ92_05485 [Ginsengibacter sp.]
MDLQKRGQLQHECKTLRRLLAFLKEENVLLKNRLSDILKDSFDKNLLGEAERFHNASIREDERMHLLRNDLASLESVLATTVHGKENINGEIDAMLRELRNNINIAENQFLKMQSDFNKYFYEKM